MNDLLQSVFSLGIQVGVLAVVAVLLARWLRPSAIAQRWLACSALVVIAALTALALLPTPDLSMPLQTLAAHWATGETSQHAGSQGLASPTSDEFESDNAASGNPAHGLGLDLAKVAAVLRQVVARMDVKAPERSLPIFAVVMATLVGMGMLRFLMAFSFSRKLRKRSKEVNCPVLRETAQQAAQALAIRRFECRESEVISDAAVVGVLRPCVILPVQWRQWTDKELHAVIAHEAAHLANRDSVWRLLACVIETIHFYNPLVRLLTKHLAFTQEVAADKLASSLVGNQTYVRSLSSLALSRDACVQSHSAGMNPVFSGYLIKRIEMLRNPQSRLHTEWWASKFVVAGAMVTFGCLGYVARTVASPQQDGQTQTLSDSGDQPAARIASRVSAKSTKPSKLAGMFNREKNDPSEVPANDEGLLKVRFSDLYGSFETGALRALANPAIATSLKSAFNSPEVPAFDIDRIDMLIGTCQLGFSYDETKEENKNSISLGMDAAEFRLDGPVDLAAWMDKYVPGAKELPGEGARKFELPRIPSFGPFPIPLAQKGDSTICFGGFMPRRGKADYSAEEQLDCVLNHSQSENESTWANAFRRVDGGIIALVATNTWIDQVPDEIDEALSEDEQKFQRAYRQVQNSIETIAFGADVSSDGNTIGVRIEVACDDESKAQVVEKAVQALIEYGLTHNAGLDHSELGPQIGKQFLTRSVVRHAQYGEEFTVTLETTIDNPNFSGVSLASFLAAEFN